MTDTAKEQKIESVWDYPRPPAIEPEPRRIRIIFNNVTIVDTTKAYRILETSHPPTYYIPKSDIKMEYFSASEHRKTFCEWKGVCEYWDIKVGDKVAQAPCWSYPSADGTGGKYSQISGYLSFYCSRMDSCWVGDEQAVPQPGDFYGGWMTSWISGGKKGVKGGPGTWGW